MNTGTLVRRGVATDGEAEGRLARWIAEALRGASAPAMGASPLDGFGGAQLPSRRTDFLPRTLRGAVASLNRRLAQLSASPVHGPEAQREATEARLALELLLEETLSAWRLGRIGAASAAARLATPPAAPGLVQAS